MASVALASPAVPTRALRESSPALSPSISASLRARTSLYGTEDRVVLDLGSRIWSYGFSGEAAPRGCFDVAQLGVTDERGLWHLDVATAWREDVGLEPATEAQVQEGLRSIFYRRLMIDPKQRKVLVAENPFLPTCVKELIARVLFDRLQVQRGFMILTHSLKVDSQVAGVSFVPTQLLAVVPTGSLTALVLDCGYQEATVVPVSAHGHHLVSFSRVEQIFAARPLLPFTTSTPRAGLALLRHLRRLLLRFGSYMPPLPASSSSTRPRPVAVPPEVLTVRVLEDIKARGLFVGAVPDQRPSIPSEEGEEVLLNLEKAYAPSSTGTSATLLVAHPTSNARGTLLIPGWVRERAMEVLFENGDIDTPSLATLIVESLERLPIDMRKTFAGSILLTGGTSMVPGFQARLRQEVDALLDRPRTTPLRSSVAILNDRAPAFTRSSLPWIGGSLAGALRSAGQEVLIDKWLAQSSEEGTDSITKRQSLLPELFAPALG